MRVFLSVASYAREYGGPAVSVSRLGAALAELGHEVGLWAPDGSARNSPVVTAAAEHGASVVRLTGNLPKAIKDFGTPDVIHDNGLWRPFHHSVAKLSARTSIPRIVSLRGMLQPWGLAFHPLRKRLALAAYQRRDLQTAHAIHLTAPEEGDNVTGLFSGVPIITIPNGVDLPDVYRKTAQCEDGIRTMLFLGRIHPKKGLLLLIEVLARINPVGWRLIIAGPDELDHSAEINAAIVSTGLSHMIQLAGPAWGSRKAELFMSADLFVLPTYSENFGIAVAEALAYAIPVVTTTAAPWSLVVDERCGWWVEPTSNALTEALSAALSCTAVARAQMGERGRKAVGARFSWRNIAVQMAHLYDSALTGAI